MNKVFAIVLLLMFLITGCNSEKLIPESDCPTCEKCYECVCPEYECICPEDKTTEKLTLRQTAICEMESKAPVECKIYRKTQTGFELVGTEICSDDEYAYTYATNGECVCKKRVCQE